MTFTFYVNGVAKASGTDSGFVQNGDMPNGGASYNYNTIPPGSSDGQWFACSRLA